MIEEGFEVLLTVDKGIPFQQNLKKYPIVVALILTHDNRLKTLLSKVGMIEKAILENTEMFVEIDLR